MLESSDIARLEKAYEIYKSKNKGYKFDYKILFLVAIFVIFAIYLFAINPKSKQNTIVMQNTTIRHTQPQKEYNQTAQIIYEVKLKSEQAKAKFEESQRQDELANKIAKKIEQSLKIKEPKDTNQDISQTQSNQNDTNEQGWLKLNFIEIMGEPNAGFDQNSSTPKIQIQMHDIKGEK
ncbi:hypothetical protein KDE12_08010 [Campylobacter sp. faydin G-105]|uniref:hypothetical protein n=1 Tax=Campylobacter anatolicus TaxID=2829105 RepID=UPI001BA0710E|nr:hypothetical protein [Campylobacter anatolicus]MBR8462783.1 hypothetical protein [Campylobacter anatolicus]